MERREDGDRSDRVPRVAERVEPAVGMDSAADQLRKSRQDERGGDEQRDERERRQDQHRDEDELVRAGLVVADLEHHPARGDGQEHEEGQRERIGVAVHGHEDGDHTGGQEEPEGDRSRNEALAGSHRLDLALARLPDQIL